MTEHQDDIVDLEEFAKNRRTPPCSERYRIRVDRRRVVVDEACLDGAEILSLVDKDAKDFRLFQKFRGGEMKPVAPDAKVDFTRPGIERFVTLPLDQTEG